jgi:hypothetical protein
MQHLDVGLRGVRRRPAGEQRDGGELCLQRRRRRLFFSNWAWGVSRSLCNGSSPQQTIDVSAAIFQIRDACGTIVGASQKLRVLTDGDAQEKRIQELQPTWLYAASD